MRRQGDNVIRVLISTDNHIGYLEKDPLRGDDSFRSFEEVLALAKSNKVDMVLLGGDLFHENKPSRRTLVRTMKILSEYCLGDDPVSLAVRSDPDHVNYMHPSYAISLPVFVIHGNHDDPTGAAGADALSALDLLAQANLVTYFGKAPDSRRIDVSPILLQKGVTKLALYGFGNIRDDVLYETWANAKQVHWLCPRDDNKTDTRNIDEANWFNLFVIHQNRVARGTAKAVADSMLPQWLDYVVWGHEHDSVPELSQTMPPIVQPGSTIATSLSEGESLPKHVILLEVLMGALKHRPIPLQTVRQYEFGELRLGDPKLKLSVADTERIEKLLISKLEEMIQRQEAAYDSKRSLFESGEGLPPRSGVTFPPKEFYLSHLPRILRAPLIRLRVEYSGGYEALNPQRFGQTYVGRVACATEMLLFFRRRAKGLTKPFLRGQVSGTLGVEAIEDPRNNDDGTEHISTAIIDDGNDEAAAGDDINSMGIPTLIEYFLYHKDAGGSGLKFLELDRLSTAVNDFVAKAEVRAIPEYVTSYLKSQVDSTLEKQDKKGSVLTAEELNAAFQTRAKEAAKRVLMDKNPVPGQEVENDGPNSRTDNEDQREEKDFAFSSVLQNVHALLSRNPKTAVTAKSASDAKRTHLDNKKVSALSDEGNNDDDDDLESDDDDDDVLADIGDNNNDASFHVSRINSKGRGRGRGRGARAAASRGKSSPHAVSTREMGARKAKSSARRALSAAVKASSAHEDNESNEEDAARSEDIVPDSDDDNANISQSRKRKTPSTFRPSSRRAAGRARLPPDGGNSRFSARSRVRNLSSTIDLDDDSE